MGYRGFKQRVAAYILHVMAPFLERLETAERRMDHMEDQVTMLLDLRKRMEGLEENIRNHNTVLETWPDTLTRLEHVEENVRNHNLILEELKDIAERLKRIEENLRHNNDDIDQFKRSGNVEIFQAKLDALKESVKSLQHNPDVSVKDKEAIDSVVQVTGGAYDDIDYFDFENYFRGSEELIRQRQEVYLPYFEGCQNVLDLGCGRGEFLQLLKEHQITATGVDFYEEFAVYGRNKGLHVVSGDAIAFLQNLPEKVDGIFAGQLVEHLTVSQIIALCKQAYEKLKPGSFFIMETPNPTCLAIYTHAFYLDPSHQRPVHPLTLKYVTEKAGFQKVQILYTKESRLSEEIPPLQSSEITNLEAFNAGMQKVSELLYGSQDYAIIAER